MIGTRCDTCGRPLGGTCRACMADAGDPECIAADLRSAHAELARMRERITDLLGIIERQTKAQADLIATHRAFEQAALSAASRAPTTP